MINQSQCLLKDKAVDSSLPKINATATYGLGTKGVMAL